MTRTLSFAPAKLAGNGGLGALNRAVVVMCVSAWESYIEEVVRESIETFGQCLRP